MFTSFDRMSYMINMSNLVLCRPLVLRQDEYLIKNVGT